MTVDKKRLIGLKGEELAIRFLKKRGYKIIARNFRCRHGEIDVVASEGDTIVFVEIKARSTVDFSLPQDAVDHHKQAKVIHAATTYLMEKKLYDQVPVRFDVVAVNLNSTKPKIELIKDAFQLT